MIGRVAAKRDVLRTWHFRPFKVRVELSVEMKGKRALVLMVGLRGEAKARRLRVGRKFVHKITMQL